jgi:hypothetical protein
MAFSISNETWVYAVIGNPGADEKLAAFHEENESTYIPILKTKNEAELFLSCMPRQPGIRYEVQALIFEDILSYAKENKSLVYVVNDKGVIQETGAP